MVTSLFKHSSIKTTEAKAKGLRSIADKMITLAKRGDLHARRQALAYIQESDVVHTLFNEVAEKFDSRQGGYTRITKLGPRKGDVASMVQIELILD
jgi:large subunit ribosomal protein L17